MLLNELSFAIPLILSLLTLAVLVNAAIAVAAEQKWGRVGQYH